MQNGYFSENAKIRGEQILDNLNNSLSDIEGIVEIRGRGLMIGIELIKPCKNLARDAIEDGLLINVTESNVIRLLPPLIISKDEVEVLTDKLVILIKKFCPFSDKEENSTHHIFFKCSGTYTFFCLLMYN